MTRLTSLLSLSLIAAAGLTSPAIAGDGFYISGALNSTTQESFNSRNTGSAGPTMGAAEGPSGTVSDKESGFGGAIGAGYKFRLAPEFWVSGEGYYSVEDVDTTTINNVRINHISTNSSYGLDLRFGTDVTEKVAIYGLAGWNSFDVDSAISYTFAPPKDDVSDDVDGFVYGGGVEIGLSEKLSTFGEFRISNDLDLDTPVDRGGVQNIEELNYTVVRTGLRYSF